jgi:nitrogen regulatory protein P-II 1
VQLITAVIASSRIESVLLGLRRFGLCGWTLDPAYAFYARPARVVRLDIVTANVDAPDVVRVISRAAAPIAPHVWVTPVDHVVRIRTGEMGPDAVS